MFLIQNCRKQPEAHNPVKQQGKVKNHLATAKELSGDLQMQIKGCMGILLFK